MPDAADQQPKAQVYRLVEISKATPGVGVVVSNVFEIEEGYRFWYSDGGPAATGKVLIRPPYHLKQLARLAQENNALGTCASRRW